MEMSSQLPKDLDSNGFDALIDFFKAAEEEN
jgi:hypothetical protein